MYERTFWKVLAAGVFLLVFSLAGYGQLGKGVITGTVLDPTGAVVPGAEVTLINQSTGARRVERANSAGIYRFDFTDVGTYTLGATSQGFEHYEVKDMSLTVGQTLAVDVKLEVAKGTQSVTVEASGTQLIQTSSSEVSGLVDRNALASLPLEIRDPSAFVNLLPGAVPSAIGNVEFNGSTRGSSVNGARGGTGNFIIEGFDNNDQGQGGRSHNTTGTIPGAIVGISPDAIQEFQVVTNNFSAQYGRQSGFVADAVMKSGTNKLHGSAFEYNRNQSLTANDFFTNKAGGKDSLVRNQFGGSLGGPIRKDKTFLFGAIEIQRLRQGAPLVLTSLTPDFVNFVKTGAFATFNESDPAGFCMQNLKAACPGAFASVRTLGPIASTLLSQFPAPVPNSGFTNVSSSADVMAGLAYPVNEFGQATVSDHSLLNETRFSTKFDHSFNATNQLSVVVAIDNFPTLDSAGGTDSTGNAPISAVSRSQNWGMTYTHFFSPTVLNEAKVSYLRNHAGFPRNLQPNAPSVVTFDALALGFGMTSSLPQDFKDGQFQYQDHMAITRGRHSLKLGAEYRRTRNASVFAAVRDGLFEFWDSENFLTDGALADVTDGLLGISDGAIAIAEASVNPQTGQKPEYYRGYRADEIGWYAQDDWKVLPRVTMNLGLRYDYFGPPHNFRTGFDSNFFFGPATTPIVTTSNNPFFPKGSAAYAAEATATFQLKDQNIWNKDLNNFAPRFGVAWDVFGDHKTVLRTGGGVFYDRFWNNLFENIRFNPPLFSFNTVGPLANGLPVSPANTPGLYADPISTSLFNSPAFQPKASPRHMDQNIRTPYSEQVFFGLQRQLPGAMVFEANYIGTFGHKLTGVVDLNTFPGRTVGKGFSSRRPNNTIASDNARGNYYNSNYSALQISLQKKLSHGLQFRGEYTYSKALDYVSDAFNDRAAKGNGGFGAMDVTNRNLDYGRADFDLRHRFVTTVHYDFPVFRSNRWLGGWSANSIVTVQTGLPFNIYNGGTDYNHDGKLIDRPDYLGSAPIANIINHSMSPADGYLPNSGNDSSGKPLFGAPALDPSINMGLWRDGRLGRNVLSGPGLATTDFSLAKKFRIKESASVQLQFNFFNIFNRSNFALPDGNLQDIGGSFGLSQATFGPRIGQFAARIDF